MYLPLIFSQTGKRPVSYTLYHYKRYTLLYYSADLRREYYSFLGLVVLMSMYIDANSRAKVTQIEKNLLIMTLLGFDMLHDAFLNFGIFL